jgi:hypothetical protein
MATPGSKPAPCAVLTGIIGLRQQRTQWHALRWFHQRFNARLRRAGPLVGQTAALPVDRSARRWDWLTISKITTSFSV